MLDGNIKQSNLDCEKDHFWKCKDLDENWLHGGASW